MDTSISSGTGVLLIMDDLSGCTRHGIGVISGLAPLSSGTGVLLIMDDLSGCTRQCIGVISGWTPLFHLIQVYF